MFYELFVKPRKSAVAHDHDVQIRVSRCDFLDNLRNELFNVTCKTHISIGKLLHIPFDAGRLKPDGLSACLALFARVDS